MSVGTWDVVHAPGSDLHFTKDVLCLGCLRRCLIHAECALHVSWNGFLMLSERQLTREFVGIHKRCRCIGYHSKIFEGRSPVDVQHLNLNSAWKDNQRVKPQTKLAPFLSFYDFLPLILLLKSFYCNISMHFIIILIFHNFLCRYS